MSSLQKPDPTDYDDSDIVIHDQPPTAWQRAWRDGIVPQLTTRGLEGLAAALERDDRRLLQGSTTMPPALGSLVDDPLDGCCVLCWALLDGKQPAYVSVGAMEDRFFETCVRASEAIGEETGVRYFLNAVDEMSRDRMRRELLAEVRLALAGRQQHAALYRDVGGEGGTA